MEISSSVGKGAINKSSDVMAVQLLLKENTEYLGPSMPVVPSGICDPHTIFLIETFQKNALRMTRPTGVVEPNSQTLFGLNGQSGPATPEYRYLLDALDALRSEATNFALRFIPDAGVRAEYVANAQKVSEEILSQVRSGDITALEGATQAHTMRNALLEAARIKSSDIGRAVAEAEKATGLAFEKLLAKYSDQLFKKEFSELGTAEQDAVFLEIVRASGRPNARFTALASKLGNGGKGLLVVSISLSVYAIATSDRPGREATKQAVGTGVSFLGSLAGGAVAGLACGPGAPICVGVGVFVGGLVFAISSDFAFDEIWD